MPRKRKTPVKKPQKKPITMCMVYDTGEKVEIDAVSMQEATMLAMTCAKNDKKNFLSDDVVSWEREV